MEDVQVKSELEWLESSLPQPQQPQQPQHWARSTNHFSKKRNSRTSPLSCGKKCSLGHERIHLNFEVKVSLKIITADW